MEHKGVAQEIRTFNVTLQRPNSGVSTHRIMSIPKKIHQSARTTELAAEVRENVGLIKALHPDWDYQFYDDERCAEYIRRHFDLKMMRLYERINPVYGAARADLFRYLLMFREGGLWLDLKSSVVRRLDNSIKNSDTIIFSQWENRLGELYPGTGHPDPLVRGVPGGEIQQWFILTEPQNPFIRSVINGCIFQIKNYSIEKHGVGALGVFRTTGPTLFTRVVYSQMRKHPFRLVRSFNDLGLKYSFFIDENKVTPADRFAHRHLVTDAHYSELKEPVILGK